MSADNENYAPPLYPFSRALEALKRGRRVRRTGWNGKGMWLFLINADEYALTAKFHFDQQLPWIAMKTADDHVGPWLASQTDLLAEDWQALDLDVPADDDIEADAAELRW